MVKRIDSQNKTEFENMLYFQVNMLGKCREAWSKLKGDKFDYQGEVIHTIPPMVVAGKNMKATIRKSKKLLEDYKKNPKKYKIDEVIPIWKIKKNRKKSVDGHLERIGFYQNALLLFIARIELQRSLRLITHTEANRRTLKTQRAIDNHMKKLLNLNPKETDALRQYISWKTFVIEGFKIS